MSPSPGNPVAEMHLSHAVEIIREAMVEDDIRGARTALKQALKQIEKARSEIAKPKRGIGIPSDPFARW